MALGKTITYTPFQETSFGYGSGEIASAHSTEFPNGTDIVKVVIEQTSGNWGTTGHISTPVSGTAVAVYNSQTSTWEVRGERDDVDAILAALNFFPADYSAARTWTPTALKDNQTTGTFANEEPPQIPDTVLTLRVYDSSNTLVSSNTVTWDADGPTFGNQRPYWSTEPAVEDLNGVTDAPIDLGTIAHGTDTENVQVKCEFREYDSETTYTGTDFGTFSADSVIYIGNKKPSTRNNSDSRFNFTGSLQEAQAFLDNVKYSGASVNRTFDMYLTITDGVVGAKFTKTNYFSQTLTANTFPTQTTSEDIDLSFDSDTFAISNYTNVPEANSWVAEFAVDATGQGGISSVSGTGVSYAGGTITVSATSYSSLITFINSVVVQFNTDFNSEFSMTLDITASNSTLGTSYSITQQTVNVTITDVDEYSFNFTGSTNWNENNYIDRDLEFDILDTSYGGNATYTIYLRPSVTQITASLLNTTSGTHNDGATITGSGTNADPLQLNGTRLQINNALEDVRLTPDFDYFTAFDLDIKAVRDNDSTVFTNYGESVSFTTATQTDMLNSPTASPYYETDDVYDSVLLNNKVTVGYLGGVDFAFEQNIYGGTYTMTFLFPDNFTGDVYFGNTQAVFEEYVADDYVDDEFVYVQYAVSDEAINLIPYLTNMRVFGSTQDFTFKISLVRDTNGHEEIYTINMTSIDEVVINNTSTIEVEQGDDGTNETVYSFTYNETGDTTAFQTTITSYTDSSKTTTTSTDYDTYDGLSINTDDTLNTVTIEHSDISSDTDDNTAEYVVIDFKLRQDAFTKNGILSVPDVYKLQSLEKNIFDITYTNNADSGTDRIFNSVHFFPATHNSNKIDKVAWETHDDRVQTYIDMNLWTRPSDYTLDNTFYPQVGGTWDGLRTDHMFGARPQSSTTPYQIIFTPSDATTSTDIATTAISPTTTGQIIYSTGWSSYSYVADVFYQDNGLKFYALVFSPVNLEWRLLSVPLTNGVDFSGSTATLEDNGFFTGANTFRAGGIGKTSSNEVFYAALYYNGTATVLDVYHQNEGGANNWGLKQQITGLNLEATAALQKSYSSVVCVANDYMLLEGNLYYYNGTTWSSILTGVDEARFSALSQNYCAIINSVDDTKLDFYKLSSGTATKIHTETFANRSSLENQSHTLLASKRDDVFLRQTWEPGAISTSYIYRFTT